MKNYGDYIGVLMARWRNQRRDDKMMRPMKDNLVNTVRPVGGGPARPVVHRHRCIPRSKCRKRDEEK